jgi:hypothetical protein
MFLGGSHEGQLSNPNCPQKILFSNRQVQNGWASSSIQNWHGQTLLFSLAATEQKQTRPVLR